MESFLYRDGLNAGIGRGTLQGRSYARPFSGIRSERELDDVASLAHAFLPRLPERAFYFGRTAAGLHGIPLPAWLADPLPLHIGVASGARRVHGHKLIGHHVRLGLGDLTRLDALPVTTAERTWCDLGADGSLAISAMVAAGDRILWRRDPLGTRESLTAAVDRYEGRRGARLMRTALAHLTDRSDSAPESELRLAIVLAGLPAPSVNRAIRDEAGRLVATPDLSWPSLRVALEYEGDHHRVDRDQWHHDVERFGRLQEIGWVALRATSADYRNPDAVLRRLAAILRAREST
jgi:hypothetical protein